MPFAKNQIHCCVSKTDKRKEVCPSVPKANCIFSTNYTLCSERGDCWTQVNAPVHTYQNVNHRSMLLFAYDCDVSMGAVIKGLHFLKKATGMGTLTTDNMFR